MLCIYRQLQYVVPMLPYSLKESTRHQNEGGESLLAIYNDQRRTIERRFAPIVRRENDAAQEGVLGVSGG